MKKRTQNHSKKLNAVLTLIWVFWNEAVQCCKKTKQNKRQVKGVSVIAFECQ